jgi:hypothetical protein
MRDTRYHSDAIARRCAPVVQLPLEADSDPDHIRATFDQSGTPPSHTS